MKPDELIRSAREKVPAVVLAATLAIGGAALTGCNSVGAIGATQTPPDEQQTTPDSGAGAPGFGSVETETEVPGSEDLPADWESWGVSKEVAVARWNFIKNQADKTAEEVGGTVTKYDVREDDPNRYFYVIGKDDIYNRYDGEFPTNRKPALW